jgi:hypothetical protein
MRLLDSCSADEVHVSNFRGTTENTVLKICPKQGLFLPILWCSHTGNHPQEELAKFGYSSERTEEKLRILLYFVVMLEAYCPNMANFHQMFYKFCFWQIWCLFFFKTIFISCPGFFHCCQVVKISQNKNCWPLKPMRTFYIKESTEIFLKCKFKILKNTIQQNTMLCTIIPYQNILYYMNTKREYTNISLCNNSMHLH